MSKSMSNLMTKKDISVVIEYTKYYDQVNHKFTYTKQEYGSAFIIITLNKNKKIDPNIIYDIYKNYNILNINEYRGNVYKRHKNNLRKIPFVNYFIDFVGIILTINGSYNRYYDYSLDDLPSDLPIFELNLCINDYKYNFNKLPDSIINLNLFRFTHNNYLTYIPKSLKTISCYCNINLSLLSVIHKNKISLKVFCDYFDSANCLPPYITSCIFTNISPTLSNLPDNLEYLQISTKTKLLHIPLSLKYLGILSNHPDYKLIVSQLEYENRSHIINIAGIVSSYYW